MVQKSQRTWDVNQTLSIMGINYQQPQLVSLPDLWTINSVCLPFPPIIMVPVENGCISNRSFPHHVGWFFRAARCAHRRGTSACSASHRVSCWCLKVCVSHARAGPRCRRAEGVWRNWPTGPRPKQGNIYWKKCLKQIFYMLQKETYTKWVHLGWLIQIWHEFSIDVLPEGDEVDELIQRSSAPRNPQKNYPKTTAFNGGSNTTDVSRTSKPYGKR